MQVGLSDWTASSRCCCFCSQSLLACSTHRISWCLVTLDPCTADALDWSSWTPSNCSFSQVRLLLSKESCCWWTERKFDSLALTMDFYARCCLVSAEFQCSFPWAIETKNPGFRWTARFLSFGFRTWRGIQVLMLHPKSSWANVRLLWHLLFAWYLRPSCGQGFQVFGRNLVLF